MRYALAAFAAALAGLIAVDAALDGAERARLAADSAFVSLGEDAGVAADAIGGIEVFVPKGAKPWRYIRRDGRWRTPDYRDAFVQEESVASILKSALTAKGTRVSGRPRSDEYFGLAPETALRIVLKDEKGSTLLAVLSGRTVPGGGGAYMKIDGDPRVYNIASNPASYFPETGSPGRPPLVDPSVVPRAIAVAYPSKIVFSRTGYPLTDLERKDLKEPPKRDPGGFERPSYEWWGTYGGVKEKYGTEVTASYARYLTSLRYAELLPAGDRVAKGFVANLGSIRLEDAEGKRNTIEVGGLPHEKKVWVRCAETRQVFSLDWEVARVIFPSRKGLMREIPQNRFPPGFNFPDQRKLPPGLKLPPGITLPPGIR